MAIDRTGISSLDTGASDITYTGDQGPKSPDQQLMATADPMLVEEYKKYVFQMEEQGLQPISFREFVEQIMAESRMAQGRGDMRMASADPILQDEYDKYVFDIQEQGGTPMSIEEFRQQAMSGMAEGGIARLGYKRGRVVEPGGYNGDFYEAANKPSTSSGQGRQDPMGGYAPEHKYSKTAAEMRQIDPSQWVGCGDPSKSVTADQLAEIVKQEKELLIPPKDEKPKFVPSLLYNITKPWLEKGAMRNKKFFIDKVLGSKNYNYSDIRDLLEDEGSLESLYQDYMSGRMSGDIDAYGNPLGGGGDGQGITSQYPYPLQASAPVDDTDSDNELDEFDVARQGLIYADGGRAGYAGGGITNLRQAYGLGKLVKKAKKALKNPIVQAALTAYGLKVAGGGGPGLFSGWNKMGGAFMRSKPSAAWLKGADMTAGKAATAAWKEALPHWYQRLNPWTTIGIPSVLGGAYTAAAPDEEEEPSWYEKWLADQKKYMADIGEFPVGRGDPIYQRTAMSADGGRIGYYNGGYNDEDEEEDSHRVAALRALYGMRRRGAQEGGLMDMGGMEKDYRQEGGFVPIGGQERADDVPARLSKNEFVFTADAVRAAGGGDIDAGAEVMENVMENLEQGGKISEESQGLEGARDMFATAQRLEGVL